MLRAVALPLRCTAQGNECPPNYTCNGSVCQPTACGSSAQCSGGATCTRGFCATCESDSDCSADAGMPTCGTAFLTGATPLLQTCGKPIGWWSYEDLCSTQGGTNYGPLNCNQLVAPDGGIPDTLSNLFQCHGQFGQSCYNGNANVTTNCCGCATYPTNPEVAFWPKTLEIGNNPSYADAGQCVNNNAAWATNVQPWLVFLKTACPTAYTYAYDDVSSTFTCQTNDIADGGINSVGYQLTFGDVH